MHPLIWTCCTAGQEEPWWMWLVPAALVLGLVIRVVWVWRHGGFRDAEETSQDGDGPEEPINAEVWARAMAVHSPRFVRPIDVPRPESVEEVSVWAGHQGFRRTELLYAPAFWVLLPLAAIGFLIHQTITDPTGANVNITIGGESVDSWPAWLIWLFWIGAAVWLLVAIGVLLLRLSVLSDLHSENEWAYEHGVAHSLHRTSVDYDDGEVGGWPTYIALDHGLDDKKAARIHEAFEQWLALAGLPPSGSNPISSTRLFGEHAKGGYFILHLPVSETAGVTSQYRWMLIAEPREDDGEMIVIPVPVKRQLQKIRAKLRRRATRRGDTVDEELRSGA